MNAITGTKAAIPKKIKNQTFNSPKSNRPIILPFFLAACLLAGPSCLSVSERLYPHVTYHKVKKNPESVVIAYDQPGKKYIIFGELSIRYNAGYKRETALTYLKNAAASYGADGIIIQPLKRVKDNWSVSHTKYDKPSSMTVDTYVLSGLMYQFLE